MDKPNRDAAERRVAEMNEHETGEFLRRSSTTYLECAINLCLSHMGAEEVAELLESEAVLLREFS